MKGITPVIAIILLMLITISMVGFAFVWFNRVTSEIGGEITEQTRETVRQSQSKVIIDAIDPSVSGHVYIRNSGTVDIAGSDIQVYKDDALLTCGGSWPATLTAGSMGDCDGDFSGCTIIKVTSPGLGDVASC